MDSRPLLNAQSRETNSTLAQINALSNGNVPLAQKMIRQSGKNRLFAMGSVDKTVSAH